MEKIKNNETRLKTDLSVYNQLLNGNVREIAGTKREPMDMTEEYIYKITRYNPFVYKELFFVTTFNSCDTKFLDFIKVQLKPGCYVHVIWTQSVFGNYLVSGVNIVHSTNEAECICSEPSKFKFKSDDNI